MSEEMLDYGKMKNNLLVYKSKEQIADICIAHYKEIERLNNIIKRFEEDLREVYLTFGEFSEEYTENRIKELKGSDKDA